MAGRSTGRRAENSSYRAWAFLVVGTGGSLPLEMWEHVGSCQLVALGTAQDGTPVPTPIVWHVFKREILADEV